MTKTPPARAAKPSNERVPFSDGWLLRQAESARAQLAALRKLFPGCFNADGSARVASAHLPTLKD